MYQITLEWSDRDRIRTKTITAEDRTHAPEKIVIGRGSKDVCDLVLKHEDRKILNTVSHVHLELFYDRNKNGFFAKNLTQNRQPPRRPNPVFIDGKKIIAETIEIKQASQIQLGKILLTVKTLELEKADLQTPALRDRKFVIQCSNPNSPHILEPEYEGLNCPICGYIVFTGTTLKL